MFCGWDDCAIGAEGFAAIDGTVACGGVVGACACGGAAGFEPPNSGMNQKDNAPTTAMTMAMIP